MRLQSICSVFIKSLHISDHGDSGHSLTAYGLTFQPFAFGLFCGKVVA